MAYSIVQSTGDGSTTDFSVSFPYIDSSHVQVLLNGVATSAFTWVNASLVRLTTAPANGVVVTRQRVTPRTSPLVTFTDGSALPAADQNTATLQLLYLEQETQDALATAVLPSAAINSSAQIAAGIVTAAKLGSDVSAQVATVAALKALTTMYPVVIVRGYAADGDGGGGVFGWNATDVSTDNAGSIIQPNAGGTGRWNRLSGYKYITDVVQFGAKGDDTTNDYTAIQAALNALTGTGGLCVGKPATFKCSTAPTVPAGVCFDLNGGTLHLTLSGDLVGVQMRDDSELKNGSVTLTGTSLVATDGKYHCPIVVGDTLSNTGYRNVKLSRLTVSSDRANGNGIFITGPSNNVTVEHICFPTSSTLGRCVLAHWAGDGSTPPALTTHPYNLRIAQITAGAMTANYTDQAIVFLSAVYNTVVEGVYCDRAKNSVVSVVAGDYGAEYAGATIKALFGRGITVSQVIGKLCNKYGAYSDSWEDNYSGAPIVSLPVLFENCHFVGDGTSGATAGLRTLKQKDATFRNCEATAFVNGALIDDSCERVRIEGGRFYANQQDGVLIDHVNNPTDCEVIGVEAYGNGTDTLSNYAGIKAVQSTRTKISRCISGDKTSETTQVWGIRIDDNSTGAELVDNYVRNTKASGTAFSLASGSGYGSVSKFSGNRCNTAITTLQGGVDPVTIDSIPTGVSGVIKQIMLGSAAPTSGTWKVGDTVWHRAPTTGGNIGWVCTTAGTPGTWKTFGTIA